MKERIERARAMLGVPFLHQGQNEKGIDCVGLLAHAMAFPFSRVPAYPRDPHQGKLEATLTELFGPPLITNPESADVLQPGDFVAMQYRGPVRHVGIVTDYPGAVGLIHTDSMVGEVTEHRLDEKWLRRIVYVWRV